MTRTNTYMLTEHRRQAMATSTAGSDSPLADVLTRRHNVGAENVILHSGDHNGSGEYTIMFPDLSMIYGSYAVINLAA